ncbi:MAG: hypothetical protein DRH12_18580 [Deltaproteobacteria bacterium]|nr:MAG: hypothetical protein DRH12_18580 [Deltaproteobacteria bacterium]
MVVPGCGAGIAGQLPGVGGIWDMPGWWGVGVGKAELLLTGSGTEIRVSDSKELLAVGLPQLAKYLAQA